jgi:methionine-rich copper-binding protein CopC
MRRTAFLAALGLLLTSSAFAHTHLAKSVPANGSVVAKAPEKITLQFEHEVRVTEFSLQKGDEKADGLLKSLPPDSVKEVTAVPSKLAPGAYVVNWRAVGADGHVMSGKVRFTVSADGATAASAKPGDSAAKH